MLLVAQTDWELQPTRTISFETVEMNYYEHRKQRSYQGQTNLDRSLERSYESKIVYCFGPYFE